MSIMTRPGFSPAFVVATLTGLLMLPAFAIAQTCTTQVVGDEDFWAISGNSDNNVIAVGKKGAIFRYDGTAWSSMASPNDEELFDVEVVDANTAFAVGKKGEILQLSAGVWIEHPGVTSRDLNAVWAASASEVYVAGKNGVLFVYNGSTWSDQSVAAGVNNKEQEDAWGDAASAYVLGDDGYLYRYDRTAGTWDAPAASCAVANGFTDLWGDGVGNIYLTRKKEVYRYDGSSCSVVATADHDLEGIYGSSAGAIYAVGKKGTVLEFDGANWVETTPVDEDLRDVWVSPAGSVIYAGKKSEITVCAQVPPQLVASWSLDELGWTGALGEVVDDGPNGLNGTAINGADTDQPDPAIAGNPGTCRYGDFDGVNDYVEVADNAALDRSDSLTVGLWVQPRSYPGSGLHTLVSKDWNYEFHLTNTGQIYWWWNQSTGTVRQITTAASVPIGEWHHVAITYEPGAQRIYLDGVQVASAAYGGQLRLNDLPLYIGVDYNFVSRAFDGLLDEVRIYDKALTPAEVEALVVETHPCDVQTPQFVVSHNNFGIHCVAETVTVNVIDSVAGTPLTSYNQNIALDTQTGRGTWQLLSGGGTFSDVTADDGLASYSWPLGETQAVFALSYLAGPPSLDVDAYQSNDPGIRDTDAEGLLVFSANGFTLTALPLTNPPAGVIAPFASTQTAAVDFPLYIAAYGQTPTDPECGVIESYTGNKTLKFWSDYRDPGFGTMNMSVDGTGIATVEGSAAAAAVVFANGQAMVTGRYDDAGLMQILVKDDTTVNADLPAGIRGATAGFVVQPADFVVSNVRAGATVNPQAADASGAVFVAAGADFQLTVTAVDAEGDSTPNYGQESNREGVRFDVNLVAPSGGSAPAVSAAVGFAAFAGGSATGFDFVWPEVGIIELVPRVSDGDYLGSGDIVGGSSQRVGRFVPDHFAVATNTPMFQTACVAGGYSYLGEGFNYLVPPVITLTAQAVGNTTTVNYTGGFFKLATAFMTNRLYQAASGSLDLSLLPLPAADPTILPASPGVATATFSGGGGFSFNRTLPVDPFDADIDLSIDVFDADGVAALGTTVSFPSISFSAGANMRYGRIVFNNAVGSERVNLPVPMTAQYFAGSGIGFVTNVDDSCTAGVTLSFPAFTENLTPGDTCVFDSGAPGDSSEGCAAPAPFALRYNEPPLAGDFNLNLQAPGATNNGSVLIQAQVPVWLTFDWDSSSPGEENPTGQATFGIFQGNSQQIYLREVY